MCLCKLYTSLDDLFIRGSTGSPLDWLTATFTSFVYITFERLPQLYPIPKQTSLEVPIFPVLEMALPDFLFIALIQYLYQMRTMIISSDTCPLVSHIAKK